MKKFIKYVVFMLVLAVGVVLVACGGGSGDSPVVDPVVVVPDVVEETINGIIVPPVPDPVEDAASIGGVSVNGDILRDSVERMLAEEFGDDPEFYEQAKAHAIAEQVAIMDPTEENVAAYIDTVRCIKNDQVLDDFKKVSSVTIDTDEREDVYIKALAGAYITSRGC